MTAYTNNGKVIFVGSKIVIPTPQEDDTWADGMIAEVDDINDNGTVVFMDDDYESHEIELDRIQVYEG